MVVAARKNDSYSDIPLDDIDKIDWTSVPSPVLENFAGALSDVNTSIERSKKTRESISFRIIMLCISLFFTLAFGVYAGPWAALAAINLTLFAGTIVAMWQHRSDRNVVTDSHKKLRTVIDALKTGA